MKKTLFAFMALAATFAATSCQSDEELTQQPTGKPMVINAVAEGIGTVTRAEMKYKYDIVWSKNDQIYVTNGTNNAAFTLQSGAGTTNGTFAYTSGSTFTSGEQVEAYYPESLVKDGNLVWPAQQTTSTVVPMYSKNKIGGNGTENFSFASLGAMLQIVFTTPQANVTLKSITIKDDDATMSGTFTVDENGKAGITAIDKAGITLDLGEGVAVSNKIQYFNIAVPAGKYSKLSFTFTATDGTVCTLKLKDGASPITLNHNTVGRLTLTGTEFKKFGQGRAFATAPNCEVTWIQLWENGPKFAEYNVGAAKAEDYGGYYAWGGSQDKVDDHNTGTVDLKGADDTATKLWGSNWRMPTQAELEALINSTNCTVEKVVDPNNTNKILGKKFTGKGAYASNSVFLPAAGYCDDGFVYGQGDYGYYWSSAPAQGSLGSYRLVIEPGNQYVNVCTRSENVYSVRAVLAEE